MAQPLASSPEAVAGIATVLERAWNDHDAKAWASLFTDDASFTNVFGTTVIGRAEIERIHAHIFATAFRDSRVTIETPMVRFLRPDVATMIARWSMSGAYDAQGMPWNDRKGVLSVVAALQDHTWQIAFMVNMEPLDRLSVVGSKAVRSQTEMAEGGRQ